MLHFKKLMILVLVLCSLVVASLSSNLYAQIRTATDISNKCKDYLLIQDIKLETKLENKLPRKVRRPKWTNWHNNFYSKNFDKSRAEYELNNRAKQIGLIEETSTGLIYPDYRLIFEMFSTTKFRNRFSRFSDYFANPADDQWFANNMDFVTHEMAPQYLSPKSKVRTIRSPRILVIGLGSGRDLDALLPNTRSDIEIVVIEKDEHLVEAGTKKYQKYKNVKIVNMSILENQRLLKQSLGGTFNLVFWMFSGIFEFPNAEKYLALKKVNSLLRKNGIAIVEQTTLTIKSMRKVGIIDDKMRTEERNVVNTVKAIKPEREKVNPIEVMNSLDRIVIVEDSKNNVSLTMQFTTIEELSSLAMQGNLKLTQQTHYTVLPKPNPLSKLGFFNTRNVLYTAEDVYRKTKDAFSMQKGFDLSESNIEGIRTTPIKITESEAMIFLEYIFSKRGQSMLVRHNIISPLQLQNIITDIDNSGLMHHHEWHKWAQLAYPDYARIFKNEKNDEIIVASAAAIVHKHVDFEVFKKVHDILYDIEQKEIASRAATQSNSLRTLLFFERQEDKEFDLNQ